MKTGVKDVLFLILIVFAITFAFIILMRKDLRKNKKGLIGIIRSKRFLRHGFLKYGIDKENDAQLEVCILPDINIYKQTNYINVFTLIDDVGNAPDAQLEEQQSKKLRPTRHLGSIPGWGALPAFNSHLIKSGKSVNGQ